MTQGALWFRIALIACTYALAIWCALEHAWTGCVVLAALAGLAAVTTVIESKQ